MLGIGRSCFCHKLELKSCQGLASFKCKNYRLTLFSAIKIDFSPQVFLPRSSYRSMNRISIRIEERLIVVETET